MITLPDTITKGQPWKYDVVCDFATPLPAKKIPYVNQYYVSPTDVAAEALRGNHYCYNYLIMNINSEGGLEHLCDVPYYDLKAPWTSSVSQALAALVFIRNNDEEYAQRVLDFMVMHHLRHDIFVEKANAIILNGWMYSLYALWKFMATFVVSRYERIFDNSIDRLSSILQGFQMKNGWTYYDAYQMPATEFYHKVHKELYEELQSITGRLPYMDFSGNMPRLSRSWYLLKKHGLRSVPLYFRVKKWSR